MLLALPTKTILYLFTPKYSVLLSVKWWRTKAEPTCRSWKNKSINKNIQQMRPDKARPGQARPAKARFGVVGKTKTQEQDARPGTLTRQAESENNEQTGRQGLCLNLESACLLPDWSYRKCSCLNSESSTHYLCPVANQTGHSQAFAVSWLCHCCTLDITALLLANPAYFKWGRDLYWEFTMYRGKCLGLDRWIRFTELKWIHNNIHLMVYIHYIHILN